MYKCRNAKSKNTVQHSIVDLEFSVMICDKISLPRNDKKKKKKVYRIMSILNVFCKKI